MFRRIPLTRSLGLEEAEGAVRTPPPLQASFPFRGSTEDDEPVAGPSRVPGNSRKRRADSPQPTGEGFEDVGGDRRFKEPHIGPSADKPGDPGFPAHACLPKAKKGTVTPHHSRRAEKYSCSLLYGPAKELLLNHLRKNVLCGQDLKFVNACFELIAASLAQSTWRRYNSALRLWKMFQLQCDKIFDFLDVNSWSERFIVWGWEVRKLAVSTIKIYLCELKKLGEIARGLEKSNTGLEKFLFQGMTNLDSRAPPSQTRVIPLTVADLGRIRENLGRHHQKLTGQSVWACCLVAFWGAFRLGELLGSSGYRFDTYSDLQWEDLAWGEDWVRIRIKSAKVRGPPGNSALLFSVPDQKFCPVSALARLKRSQENFSMGKLGQPIFRESNGKFLTKQAFLGIIKQGTGTGIPLFTGRSFRSALPSALESFPHIFKESHVKALGRWRGRSYQVYMRNDESEFRRIFKTVSSVLLKKFFVQGTWKSDPVILTESWVSRKGSSAQKGKPSPARSQRATRKERREETEEA